MKLKFLHLSVALCFLVLLSRTGYSQTTYSIPNSSCSSCSSYSYAPANICNAKYTAEADIYPSGSLGFGTITKVAYPQISGSQTNIPIKIYMTTTTASAETAGTWSSAISGATLVYSGNASFTSTTWTSITLTTPYAYSSNNLEILVECDWGTTTNCSGNPLFFYYTSSYSSDEAWTSSSATTSSLLQSETGSISTQPVPIEVTIAPCTNPTATISSSINVQCRGSSTGSATASASGGTTPYTYSWSPSGGTHATASNLSAGTYMVTVSVPGGCSNTATVTITQPATGISASISSTAVSPCSNSANGTATASASGGTAPYTYSWFPSAGLTGASTASAGNMSKSTYTCTVTDANGCIASATVTIGGPATVTGNISSQTNISCNGGNNGSVTIAASGGTSPYTYSWSPSGGTTTTASNLSAGTYTCTITDIHGCTGTVSATITQPGQLRDSISSYSNILCYGGTGSATVGVKGGTTAYTYSWSPGGGTSATKTGLTAGTYTVTVTDHNGCTGTASVSITQPSSALAASISSSKGSCNGQSTGSATVSPSGGTSPYTYSWAPSGGSNATASNLAAGNYTVTVTDHNGCTKTVSVTITQPSSGLGISIESSSNGTCTGGSATVTGNGGSPPYTYLWSPGGATTSSVSNLIAGIYTATITDNLGCTASITTTISDPPSPTASITSSTNVSCNGGNNGSATVTASGGTTPYTYSWSGGGTTTTKTGLTAGTYTVTVTSHNTCTATATVIITQPAVLNVSTAITNVSCNGGNNGSISATPSGGTSPYTYSWSGGGTNATKTGLTAGTYTITVTDNNGCTATASATITQPVALSVSASTTTNVSCSGGANGSVSAMPSGGTSPYTYSWSGGGTNSTQTGLTAGTYTITLTDNNGCTATASTAITQPAVLTVSASATANGSCNGSNNGSVSASPSGGTSPYTYSWSGGGTNSTKTGLAASTYTITLTDNHGCTATASAIITQPVVLTVSASTTANVLCNGGSTGIATANTPSGGTSPYTYSWTPTGGTNLTASNLTAGTYTITVKDNNGCMATSAVIITQPVSPLGITIASETNVFCSETSTGSVTANAATGGTSPYTYNWTPTGGTNLTASGLNAGTYTITVTDNNGCTATASATIYLLVLRDSIASYKNTCVGAPNGTATVGIKYGTSPYTYLWSPGGQTTATATGLSTGTYSVSVTDNNGCNTSTSVVINTDVVSVAISPSALSICPGECSTLAALVSGGVTPFSYVWSPGGGTAFNQSVCPTVKTTYTVTVHDNIGCSATASKIAIVTFTDSHCIVFH